VRSVDVRKWEDQRCKGVIYSFSEMEGSRGPHGVPGNLTHYPSTNALDLRERLGITPIESRHISKRAARKPTAWPNELPRRVSNAGRRRDNLPVSRSVPKFSGKAS